MGSSRTVASAIVTHKSPGDGKRRERMWVSERQREWSKRASENVCAWVRGEGGVCGAGVLRCKTHRQRQMSERGRARKERSSSDCVCVYIYLHICM